MPILSVSIPHDLVVLIDDMIRQGVASNKAQVVRQALVRYAEDQAVEAVLRAEQELKDGKEIRGDLQDILKRM